MSKPKPKPIAPKGASKPNIIVLNPPKGKRLLAKNIKPVKAVIPAAVTASGPVPIPAVVQTVETTSEITAIEPVLVAQVEQLPENDCCKEKKSTIYKLTVQNVTLKSQYDKITKAHDALKAEYALLEKKYKEKVDECNKQHNMRPPILSISKFIDLL